MTDAINHPAHYTGHPSGIECIQITEHMGFNLGNAVKYLVRHNLKGKPLEDLRKCEWYINREIYRRSHEMWKIFPLDDRYEISSSGNVRRIDSGRVRRLVKSRNGYLTFMLAEDGKNTLHYVHRAVALTFFGDIPIGMVVCHNDGNRENNHVTNLRVDSQINNMADRRKHGTHYFGKRNPAAKLTIDDVVEIRLRSDSEHVIAKEYGVSHATIGRIRRGESWQDHRFTHEILFEKLISYEPDDVGLIMGLLWKADTGKGNAIEDLKKAAWYIQREIDKRQKHERS